MEVLERRREYALEVFRLLRRRLLEERVPPAGLDLPYDFHAEDVRLEPHADEDEVVVLFRVRDGDRTLGFRMAAFTDYSEMGLLENPVEVVEMNVADVLTDLVEDFDTGTISEPDDQGISWVLPRRRRSGRS